MSAEIEAVKGEITDVKASLRALVDHFGLTVPGSEVAAAVEA